MPKALCREFNALVACTGGKEGGEGAFGSFRCEEITITANVKRVVAMGGGGGGCVNSVGVFLLLDGFQYEL